jgi:hypothetical protein
MVVRKSQDDLSRRVDELQARIAAIESNQATGVPYATDDPVRTTRRDMLRRAGIAAAGVAGAVGGIALLDQQRAAAANGGPVVIGASNAATGATTSLTNSGAGAAFSGVGGTNGTGVAGSAAGASGWGFSGAGGQYGVRAVGGVDGVIGVGTGAGALGVHGIGATGATGVVGKASGAAGWGIKGQGTGYGVVGVGLGSTLAPDLAAISSGRLHQASLISGPPSITSSNQESTRDAQGVQWLSDGHGGWAPTAVGGLNIGVYTAVITSQPGLAGSDGATWVAMDPGLVITFTPKFHCQAVIYLNADLWTAVANYNQDIGVAVSGTPYPTAAGQPEAWKESGGSAGLFSPNAAFLHAVLPLRAGTAYTFTAVWKTSVPNGAGGRGVPSKIFAGAGPISTKFSPTRLTVHLLPDSHTNVGASPTQPPARVSKPVTRNDSAPKSAKNGQKTAT